MPTAPTLDWVIDSDTHITEPPDVWTARLPAKYREQAPRIVHDPTWDWDVWQIGGSRASITVGHTAVAGWKEPFPAAPKRFEEVPKAAHDANARLAYMDSIGVWAMALYPNVGGFGNEAFLKLGDPELMLACVRAYNDFLIDWIAPDPRRFIPILATPFWDAKATAEEIARSAKKGHKGVLFTGEPQRFGQPSLGDPHWDPLWQAACEADLPVSFHIGSGSLTEEFTPKAIATYGASAINAKVAVGLFLENGKQVVDLLSSGVLARFPKLKVVSVESGIGFIPFILEALDYAFDYSKVYKNRPEFTMKPSEYFARQVYGCYFFEELAPQRLLDKVGVDNVLFETDYPHPVCLFGNVREKIDAGLRGAPADVRRKLLWENAAKLYRVGEPDRKVAPV
ncbi:MAG TPA: amidohydrolase family protein [Myxococcota bacterium]|nr:amidohydrolase family protein [Myxococcota bacterium]